MATVIEIDGVRHLLVDDKLPTFNCSDCSLNKECKILESIGICEALSDKRVHFEIEK